jgi:catechol 2,3-dioxygenase-like lactoylglutathione lyase family enzyme
VFAGVTLAVSDLTASRAFYDIVLATIGDGYGELALVEAEPVTRRLHIGFVAPSRDAVDAFWRAGTEAGYRDDGAPGPRPQYSPDYYGAFLLDPDGNSAEAVHHGGARTGRVDHLWLRVADVAASKAFYLGLGIVELSADLPERASFRLSEDDGGFSVVAGEPTVGAHLALFADRGEILVDPDGNTVELVGR